MTGRGLILAAPASGSGKTMVTAGLARHLLQRGLSVATVALRSPRLRGFRSSAHVDVAEAAAQ